jgi:hypothetical protein
MFVHLFYRVRQDYKAHKETFAYIERLDPPPGNVDKVLHHNAKRLFGFAHGGGDFR